MNGHWTPYHGNPALYRQKFALVANIVHKLAPKAAMIWCPDEIDAYYPGDAACDWVGVNLYSVPFLDNDPTRAAFMRNPIELLDPIYKRYSARKPIAIDPRPLVENIVGSPAREIISRWQNALESPGKWNVPGENPVRRSTPQRRIVGR